MRFTVENAALAEALALIKGSVAPRTTIPILAHVAVTLCAAAGIASPRRVREQKEREGHAGDLFEIAPSV